MFYSKLYKEHYPFKSPSDLLSLNEEERALLMKYIKRYPPRAVEALLRARKYGIKVEGYPSSKWNTLLPSLGLSDIMVDLREMCEELMDKINKNELVTEKDLDNINLVLYSNKYCRLLSHFIFSTP